MILQHNQLLFSPYDEGLNGDPIATLSICQSNNIIKYIIRLFGC